MASDSVSSMLARRELTFRLAELNDRYFVSREGGKTAVFGIEPDVIFKQNRTKLVVSSFTDIRQLYSHERYKLSNKENARLYGIGEIWLEKFARRRTHLGGIIFDPSEKPGELP